MSKSFLLLLNLFFCSLAWGGSQVVGNLSVSGNVGVGTTSNASIVQRLDVQGTARMTGFILTTNPSAGYVLTSSSVGVGTWMPGAGGVTSVTASPPLASSGGATPNISVISNPNFTPNVGIGSTAPGQALDVHGTVRATSFIGDGSQLTGISAGGWSRSAPYVYTSTSTDNVGIGSSAPQQALDVLGTINLENFSGVTSITSPVQSALYVNGVYGNYFFGGQPSDIDSATHSGLIGVGQSTGGTVGSSNSDIAIGLFSLYQCTDSFCHSNIAIGTNASHNLTIGQGIISIGDDSGEDLTNAGGGSPIVNVLSIGNDVNSNGTFTNINNIITLGNFSHVLQNNDEHEITIGTGVTGAGSSSVTLGESNINKTILRANVGIGSTAPGQALDVQGTTAYFGMQSANGTQWRCKPNNAGVFTCT